MVLPISHQPIGNNPPLPFRGIVTLRQLPETAKGTIFVSLEDEHGSTQVIV